MKYLPKFSVLAFLLASSVLVFAKLAASNETQNVLVAFAEKKKVSKKIHKSPTGKAYPAHWGAPPLRQTRDLRPLPGGYGRGSGTLARWIQQNLDKENGSGKQPVKPPAPPAIQLQLVPGPAPARVPELVAPPPRPDPVAPPVFRPGGGGPVDKSKVAQLKKSLNTWEDLKEKCGGNYSYGKHWSSWVGFGHTTEVVVQDNKVVERRYKSFSGRPRPVAPGQPPAKPQGISWSEKGEDIGTHKQGHPAKTLDELYKEAAGILDRPVPPFQRLGLRFDKQGLLLACYTQDTRIADDAPTKGVNISKITLGKAGKKPVKLDRSKLTHSNLRLTKSSNGKTIKVHQGQKIAISLAGNPTTGFTWNNMTKSEVVKLSGEVTHRASNRLIGAPGISTATFEAVAGGKGSIVLEYKRIWEKNPPAETFKVNLVVAGKESGAAAAGGSNQAEIKELEQRIAKMKDFAKRARFTPDGHKKFLAELANLEKKLAERKSGKGGKKPQINIQPIRPIKPRPIKPGARKPYPKHWGNPPLRQTRDLRPLPGGYGMGSSTLANWIKENMERDKNRETAPD